MASDSDCCGSSSSDEETVPVLKKRKHKIMVYSSDSDDGCSDVERKPRSKRKPQPLCESDSEIAENTVIPPSASYSSNSGEYTFKDDKIPGSRRKASSESSDNDEQSEKCPICLSKFNGQEIGTPESCDHNFCLECLQEWAKKVNTCPVDRLLFNLILIRHHLEGKIFRTVTVENQEFIDDDDEDTDSSFYDTFCEVCGENDNEERLLLCDDCDSAYHCECLEPPLTSVPRTSWCCPSCTAKRNGEHYLSAELLPEFLEIINTQFRPHSLTLATRNSPRTYADQVYQRIHQQGAARTAPVRRVTGEISQHPRRSPVFSRTQRPVRHTSLIFSNTSSSESSDENVEYTRNTGRRRRCPEIRSQRQTNIQEVKTTTVRRIASRLSTISSSGQQFATFSTFQRNDTEDSGLLVAESDDDSFEYRFSNSYEEGGVAFAQASAVRHRANHRVKESLSSNPLSGITETKTSPVARCPSPASSSCDILGDILQTQAVLHSPSDFADFVVIRRDGSVSLKPTSNGQQRPLNPMHHSPVKSSGNHSSSQKSSYVSSSPSSSSVSGSSHYYGVCTMPKSAATEHSSGGGFDNESYSTMTSRSHYNVNLVDDFKKDSFDASHNKESKTNSDDEVDIYSDIESVGDTETQMDDDLDERLKAYKCEESEINNNDDGTDSSENELVIDEDVHVEEENEKLKDDFVEDGICESNQPYVGHNSETQEGSEGSVCSDLVESYSDNQENNEGKHNSPGSREEDSGDAFNSIQRHGSSQDGFPLSDTEPRADISEEQEETQNEADCDVQNETDCDDSIHGENSLGAEADEENSLDSAKGASSDVASSEHASKVIDTIASPSEHSRSAEEEDQAESNFSNDNHFMSHDDDKQMCDEEQDSKSGSEVMEAENEDGVEESLKNENEDDSMECEDREQEMNGDDEPSESLNKDSNENIQSDDESDNQNDADSDLGDHEESGNEKVQQCTSPTGSTLKDDQGSEREDDNISEEDFHDDQVEHHNSEIQEDVSETVMQSEHSVEQKAASEPDDVENSMQSDDEIENRDLLPVQSFDNSDMSGHQFESTHTEENKTDADEHFSSQNTNDLVEKDITEDKMATDHEDNTVDSHNTDLGIEDISDAASDDLNQSECAGDIGVSDRKEECDILDQKQNEMDDVEKNVARLFEQDSNSCGEHKTTSKAPYSKRTVDEVGKFHSSSKHSSQSNDDDQEEGEIIEDPPVRKKQEKHDKIDYGHDDVDDYIDMTPRISISDLPRIPKIKRDRSKNDVPEEIPLELKRTSVLGRVDLGSSDISWKRLSKHTRERSYRDGRPKDERLLYREREGQSKDKKSGSDERRAEEKYRETDRRREDGKKQDNDKSKDKSQRDHSRDRKSEKSKDSYDKSVKSRDWSYSSQEKRDRDKQHEKSYKDRHDRERYDRDKDRYERTKDRYDKEKDRYKSEDRYEREKDRDDERFDRDEDRFDRMKHDKEKSREKDRKHKHKDKDRKSETSSKDGSQSKHKRSHSRDHFCEKQKEREVRKIDDKLKIVVEHKDPRKDKLEKHAEKKESKHDKKYKDDGHRHHEHRKKDRTSSPYKELAPIESKEIFAKGDSIIINVNFSRSSSKESVLSAEDTNGYARDSKKSLTSDLSKVDHVSVVDDLRTGKLKHTMIEKDRNVEITGNKRPSTPPERIDGRSSQVLSVGESYWQETDDTDIKSPPEDKCHTEKPCSDDDDDGGHSVDAFGGDDHFSDSDDEPVSENQIPVTKVEADSESVSGPAEQEIAENSFPKENDSFTVLRRRSPHPPSPPSPPDNDDSYDPCEPTRSPSPPPISPPPIPPLISLEKPKPPPSPELPPLPPEPEPTDTLVREDPRAPKHSAPCPPPEFLGTSSVSSPVSSQPLLYTSNTLVTTVPLPNIRVPPPNFIPHSVGRNVPAVPPQLIPPRTMNWPVSNPPSMLFPSNQVPQVIRGTFVQAAVQSPSTVSVVSQMGTMLPPGNTIPIVSQVRHMQMNAHPSISANTMIPSMPLPHLNLTQMPISSLGQPPPGLPNSILSQHSNVTSTQNPPSSFTVSAQNQARTVSSQSQLTSISVSHQNQSQASSPVPNQTGSLPVSGQSQSRLPPPPPTTTLSLTLSQKAEKPCKYSSPPNDKTEVVDMDVDSPYSPGDSPSMDSAYDYSPPSSPLTKNESVSKDPFDSLLGPNQKSSSKHSEFGLKGSSEKGTKNKSDHLSSSSKKQKTDHRSESSKVRHSVRLQFTDKGKSSSAFLKEKLSDKRDILKKLDESQLKILDELPSSAVEMQVKEKFLKKLNRQERVIEEVKLALKPYYTRREINKDEYKDVLRKSVPKICHNKTGEINPVKVKSLVEGYVKKVKYLRKKAGKKSKASKFL